MPFIKFHSKRLVRLSGKRSLASINLFHLKIKRPAITHAFDGDSATKRRRPVSNGVSSVRFCQRCLLKSRHSKLKMMSAKNEAIQQKNERHNSQFRGLEGLWGWGWGAEWRCQCSATAHRTSHQKHTIRGIDHPRSTLNSSGESKQLKIHEWNEDNRWNLVAAIVYFFICLTKSHYLKPHLIESFCWSEANGNQNTNRSLIDLDNHLIAGLEFEARRFAHCFCVIHKITVYCWDHQHTHTHTSTKTWYDTRTLSFTLLQHPSRCHPRLLRLWCRRRRCCFFWSIHRRCLRNCCLFCSLFRYQQFSLMPRDASQSPREMRAAVTSLTGQKPLLCDFFFVVVFVVRKIVPIRPCVFLLAQQKRFNHPRQEAIWRN